MILAAHQPAYLPWPSYLDRIAKAGVFVLLDGVQFERGSFTNRNRIKTQHGSHWLTVPIKTKGHMTRAIRDLQIDPMRPWAKTHLKTIYHAYSKAPRFFEGFKTLEWLYGHDKGGLSDLCLFQLMFWLREYGIYSKKVHLQPVLPATETKGDLILALCRLFKCDTYLSGPFGRDYLDLEAFQRAGIKVEWHEWKQEPYPQLWGGEFIPNLSILDYWMNVEKNPWEADPSWSLVPTPTTNVSDAGGR